MLSVLILAKGMWWAAVFASTLLHVVAAEAAPATSTEGVRLSLSINGLPLSERPFVDHTHQWPPALSWQLESLSEQNLEQTAYTLDMNGARAGEEATADMRHDIVPAPVSLAILESPFVLLPPLSRTCTDAAPRATCVCTTPATFSAISGPRAVALGSRVQPCLSPLPPTPTPSAYMSLPPSPAQTAL